MIKRTPSPETLTTRKHWRAGQTNVAGALLLGLLISMSLSAPCLAQEQERRVVDFTKPPEATRGARFSGMAGGEGGGISGVQIDPRYTLPISITIQSAGPLTLHPGQQVTMNLLIRNSGGQPFDLPVVRGSLDVHAPGERGRRSFVIKVNLSEPGEARQPSLSVVWTASASSRPDSFVRILPGEEMVVRLATDLDGFRPQQQHREETLEMLIVCSEWTSDDDRYYVRAAGQSKPVESANRFTVTLLPDPGK